MLTTRTYFYETFHWKFFGIFSPLEEVSRKEISKELEMSELKVKFHERLISSST